MRLIRLCLVTLPKSPSGDFPKTVFVNGYQLELLLRKDEENGNEESLLIAGIGRMDSLPKLNEENRIDMPDALREDIEAAIETYSNLLAVTRSVKRRISSPSPVIGLIAENDEERTLLRQAVDFVHPTRNRGIPAGNHQFDQSVLANATTDRADGLALLAEALCHDHSTGRFHELVRLFERGFRTSGQGLIRPLSKFLSPNGMGYKKTEIVAWVEMRDRSVHADRPAKFLLESDTTWIVPRILQAAFDVLLNKQVWNSKDPSRRSVWQPTSGTASPDADIFATKGHDLLMNFQLFDEFRRFPLHLRGVLTQLPDGWWPLPNPKKDSMSHGQMNLRTQIE